MNKKILTNTLIAIILVSILSVGLISAYFTDVETKTNTFTVGSIDIELDEPNWDEPTNIVPEEEIAKDPLIKNTGSNEAFVFMEVEVPYANIVTASADGTKNAPADTELFTYEINDGWVQFGEAVKDEDAKIITYRYAYANSGGMVALSKDAATPTLFDTVKFANVVSGQNLEGSTQHVVVKAYAIQTTNITDGNIAPANVWAVVSK